MLFETHSRLRITWVICALRGSLAAAPFPSFLSGLLYARFYRGRGSSSHYPWGFPLSAPLGQEWASYPYGWTRVDPSVDSPPTVLHCLGVVLVVVGDGLVGKGRCEV